MLVLVVAACNDDDTDDCIQSDWVGTYTGTAICDGTTDSVSVTITASGSEAVIIEYELGGLTTTYDPITPVGCVIDYSATQNGLTADLDATLNMDNLTFTDVLSGNGQSITCNITATRD